jgi:hypothetical protein
MAITKCRIWLWEVNRFTGTRTCFLRSLARHSNVSLEGEDHEQDEFGKLQHS